MLSIFQLLPLVEQAHLRHLVDGIKEGEADAVLAASIFHYGEYSIKEAKKYMYEHGIEMRL